MSVNWEQLRKFRQVQPTQGPFDLDSWTAQLQKDIRQHTQTLDTAPEIPVIHTQDALLQITHDMLDDTIPHLTEAILAADLTKAFDRIRHDAILKQLQVL
ncbi:hypothetical protein HPB50_017919 [Hyalomma asiaticum]|uniref:Uncharacterized protein n=1 Tax=Hyalomma asiaticum TaxID=266040 RepID=A0ACB7T2U4_HYAAI|nr:hypothetical protein HPB50_017919 [Hyalomma asiaticum]